MQCLFSVISLNAFSFFYFPHLKIQCLVEDVSCFLTPMQRNFNALLEKYIQSSYLYSNYNFFGSRLFMSVHIQVKCSFSGCMCSLYPKRKNSGRIRCNQKRRRIGGESTNGLVSLKNRVSLPWTHDLSYK